MLQNSRNLTLACNIFTSDVYNLSSSSRPSSFCCSLVCWRNRNCFCCRIICLHWTLLTSLLFDRCNCWCLIHVSFWGQFLLHLNHSNSWNWIRSRPWGHTERVYLITVVFNSCQINYSLWWLFIFLCWFICRRICWKIYVYRYMTWV